MRKTLFTFLFSLILLPAFSQVADKQNADDRGYLVKVGDKAPDFEIKYLDGRTNKLSNLKGKVIMLQFTASWCSVCRKEMPHIESEIWKKHKNNPNFILLGVDYKEDPETVKAFVQKVGITYPLILDETGEIFHKYAAPKAGVTRNIIIDRNGKIIFLTRLFDQTEFNQMKQIINNEFQK